jgi:large subunit ribosomal protein L24
MSLGIKKGDLVVVRKGRDKGKTGKVLRVASSRIRVEGVNMVKKHMKKTSEQQPSGIVEMPSTLNIANVSLWCSSCKKGVRCSVRFAEDKSKLRVCRKCGNTL